MKSFRGTESDLGVLHFENANDNPFGDILQK